MANYASYQTAQLLEALHAAPISTEDHKINPTSPGLLIANDADLKRAHLLIHQSARIPSDKFMVTNLDASSFPWLSLGENSGQTDRKLRFDKILCDVPCSGDGTLRKNPGIWRTWNVGNGNGLHS
jgi:multisite-specific tRNA:(cytosine-C5)-methyltransferase